MVVTRLHSKLFEAAALDLDRRTRFHFVGQNVRPQYIKEIERHLEDVTKPDIVGELHFLGNLVEAGPIVGGRFHRLKAAIKRVLRPYHSHNAQVQRLMTQRLFDQHEAITKLARTVVEQNAKLREELANLPETLRAEFAEEFAPAPAVVKASASYTEGKTVAAGSKLILGTVAVKKMGYVHFDPTAPGTPALDQLPVLPGTMTEIVGANVLEYYKVDEVRDSLLPYWASLLQEGGKLSLIADDLGAAGDRYRDGQIDFNELADVFFGDGRRTRKSAYTPELLWQYVEEAGLTDPSVTNRKHRPEAGAYGFELSAFRSAS